MYIGVDVGGTKIEAVAVTWDGEILHRHRCPTGLGPQDLIRTIDCAVAAVCNDAGIQVSQAHAIGIGMPGAIEDGVVKYAVNLRIDHLDVAGQLQQMWGVRPVVDNDVNVAAVGAWILERMAQGSIAYLNVGTGLAAGLIINGTLWRGARGSAGEIGYVSIDPDGPADDDGLMGGLETYAGGCGIERQATQDGVSAVTVLTRADSDPHWSAIKQRLFFGVASAVRLLVLTLDVDEVLVGGGLTGIGDDLMAGTQRVLGTWAAQSPFLASLELASRVRMVDPEVPYAAVGAAMVGAGRG